MIQEGDTIGIPRALLYHKYFILWEAFLKNLNYKIVLSPETNVQILKDGINIAVDENCLAIKIFLGHVNYLKDKVQHIFVPRIASVYDREQNCAGYMGLYDIVNNSFDNLSLLSYNVDVEYGVQEEEAFVQFGIELCGDKKKSLGAYTSARQTYEKHCRELIEKQSKILESESELKILVFSHPYTIHDSLIGKPIVKFLEKEGASILYTDRFDFEDAHERGDKVSKPLHWTYLKEYLGAVAISENKIDGIIYAISFPCGNDSLVVDVAQRKFNKIPSLILSIDELHAEAGLVTRLESFIDILRLKKKNAKRKK